MSENKVLRRISDPKKGEVIRYRKFNDYELANMYQYFSSKY
jgi:hypothetical protein